MHNAKLTQAFLEEYHNEIQILIDDFELKDAPIVFDGKRPDGLSEEPTSMWSCEEVEREDGRKWGFAIRFCWRNLIDDPAQLRYGLIVLARCLYEASRVAKGEFSDGSPICNCDACGRNDEDTVKDGFYYACASMQRLLDLFPDEDIKLIMDYGCFCKNCRREALPNQVANDSESVINNGGFLTNAEWTQAFINKYRAEIDILIAELGLEDQNIRILDGTPDEGDALGIEPEEMIDSASCWNSEWFEDISAWGRAIRFGWDNITDNIDELHEGLVSLAYCLRSIWQLCKLNGGAWHNSIAPQLIPHDALSHDRHVYQYEAVHRLFGLFSREEIKEILSENEDCKWCQAIELKPLRLVWPDKTVLST